MIVTSIGDAAFYEKGLTSIVLPSSLKSIGSSAFYGNELTNIELPDGLVSIGDWAFYGNELTNIELPDGLLSIGIGVFYENQLSSIKLPANLISIGSSAFSYNQLNNVELPDSLKIIGASAFAQNQLSNVELPDGLTNIGLGAFAYNQLSSVVIPESVTNIGMAAFMGNNLIDVTILNSTAVIGSMVFDRNQTNPADLVIKGYDPSTAKDYALANGYTFEVLNDSEGDDDRGDDGDSENGNLNEERDIDLNILGGSLEFLSTPSTSTFDLIKITGNQVISSTSFNGSLLVGDSRGTGEGWRLQVTASQFEEVETEGGFAVGTQPLKLPKGVLSLKPVNSIEQVSGGDNVLPSVVMDSEQVIDIDSFVTLVSAGLNEGMGAFEIRFPSDALTVALDPSMKVIDTITWG